MSIPERKATFSHRGVTLSYLSHPYNHASRNMRSIEVPIIRHYLELAWMHNPQTTVLEFGNVLEHYGPRDWSVLDVKEKGPGITNADVMKWEPPSRYSLIVSISTLEHIGFGAYVDFTDMPPFPHAVVARLKSWLAPGGVLVMTVPAGFNPMLDLEVHMGKLGVDHTWYMYRVNDANEWADCTVAEGLAMPYGKRWKWGSGMGVLQVGELGWR